jgi:adenine-specific DNA-methyltransferase
MASEVIKFDKTTGTYYTPAVLAEFLAEHTLDDKTTTIFDPSYGEGALLLAAEKVATKNKLGKISLFGCDIKPVNGLLQHLPKANFIGKNFLDYSIDNKFSVVLMNPPYVRHKQADTDRMDSYRKVFPDFKILHKTADLWAFFLVKTLSHLNEGGSIGAILPWSFLQADYAQPLRKFLSDNFGSISYISLSNKYFEHAEERVVLIWMKHYGTKCQSIMYSSVKELTNEIDFSELPIDVWLKPRVIFSSTTDLFHLIERLHTEFGFTEFQNHATVRIGVVTGADKFFVLKKEVATEMGFKRTHLIPIITSAKELTSLTINTEMTKKRLLDIGAVGGEYLYYIDIGIATDLHLGAHASSREPWYAVKIGEKPDAFFPYRMSKIPFLVVSQSRMQSTNSIHRIYFKNLNDIQIKWLQISLISAFSQLSLEVLAKTYGRGVLKVEPGNLKKCLVLLKNDRRIEIVYDQVERCLLDGDKESAMQKATDFIASQLNMPNAFVLNIRRGLKEMQKNRLGIYY